MKKILLILTAVAILTVGAVTAVSAMDNNYPNQYGFRGSMMNPNSDFYKSMIDLMRRNGLKAPANAMENRDFNAMNEFMNNMTDEQYNQMIDIMNSNGNQGMGRMMQSFGREDMVNMHNSMMGGRY